MILSHDRPDGDALGSIGAMKRIIEAAGRSAVAFIYDELAPRYRFLDAILPGRVSTSRMPVPLGTFTRWPAADLAALDAQFDGVLILDTCSWGQLEPAAAFLRQTRLPKLIVDHHVTRDDLTGASPDILCLIDPTAASTCVLLHEWCAAMNWKFDESAAEALFTGVTTDTGWFRFSNTDGRTMRTAAALLDAGVRADRMHARLLDSYSPARLRLMCEMLSTLQFHAGGAVALMWLTKDMFDRSGAVIADTEDLVNEPMAVEQVIVTVMLTDMADGKIRVNLRSKSPEIAGRDIDVAAIAGQFGGGGHRRAAGTRVPAPLDEVRNRMLAAVMAAMEK